MIRLAIAALIFAAAPLAAQDDVSPLDGNAEMAAMFAADQDARKGDVDDWREARKADRQRRERTRELLDAGELTTGPDFYAAAFIFQHGDDPEDYLLAHVLAVRALGLGMKEAEWIAAATLDRYLQSIARDQVYGTQYQSRAGEEPTQGRYDPDLLTDQLRNGARVETLREQQAMLQRMKEANKQPE